ncbi:phosphotransferase family protein [Ectobacillus ponti]|uniref:Phosphotransferase family protein n=1 Tax=Ectobacillus ponti TaxID=2961894 RepID=A0AA42BNB8_9BACI|nr:phosphotransferase family protein [Ectobacillus ponti]MCP8967497.1 phosphotransferase family protein [Ectobacillus ponti]
MNMEWLEQILGENWRVTPAGGATGDAYIAVQGEKKLFLKRNTSPFLAVLSAEGIVPKLLWTKRMTNGDVISAQSWLSGRKLEPLEMKDRHVAQLLKKIHASPELLQMMQKLRKDPVNARGIYEQLLLTLKDQKRDPLVQRGLLYLEEQLEQVRYEELVVCHCDVNHNNWLLSDEDELYLIDWDGAVIADPALDIGMLLYWYVPQAEWEEWLHHYGLEMTPSLLRRMKWYVVAQSIVSIQWYTNKEKPEEVQYWRDYLQQLLP